LRYGIPYKGSKNRIAKWVVDILPASDTLVDLFAGGCAVTHAAILSHKWKRVIANDLLPAPNVFQDATRGRFHDADMVTTREQFFGSSDFATRLIYSFGNDTRSYIYSREVERVKLAAERMIVAKTPKQRRLLYKSFITELEAYLHDGGTTKTLRNLQRLERLKGLQGLERLERLQGLQGLEGFEVSNLDYRDVTIPSGATVYADPPYRGTTQSQYGGTFDHEQFDAWLDAVDFPVYVSEYTCPSGCVEIASTKRMCSAAARGNRDTTERLFVQERFIDAAIGMACKWIDAAKGDGSVAHGDGCPEGVR
jgi:hypothetical protein